MAAPLPDWVRVELTRSRVGRLGTTGNDGAIRLVPICFALVGHRLVSAVDHKPKRVGQLRRLDDMALRGEATVLVDHYDDADWTQLWWIRVRGAADVLDPASHESAEALDALCAKYPQYAERRPSGPAYRIALDEVRWWRFDDPSTPTKAPGPTSTG